MTNPKSAIQNLKSNYWPLIKSLQTGLLLTTGLAGYMSARCPVTTWQTMVGLSGSLLLAISGSTALNMWYDRDIDAKMQRTCLRPLPAGKITPHQALAFGLVLSLIGVAWAMMMDLLYGAIVFAGIFFDLVVYTVLLKRRTAWSIIGGGIAGGMPILAGRVLGTNQIDWIGITLSLAIVFWIPTHILTFSMRNHNDYIRASLPTFPSIYGFNRTRIIIAASSITAAIAIAIAAVGIGMTWGYLRLIAVLSTGLFLLAISSLLRPSEKVNFGLFKYASLYMLSSMLLMIIETM